MDTLLILGILAIGGWFFFIGPGRQIIYGTAANNIENNPLFQIWAATNKANYAYPRYY